MGEIPIFGIQYPSCFLARTKWFRSFADNGTREVAESGRRHEPTSLHPFVLGVTIQYLYYKDSDSG
jgi:hypothetical protein